MVIKTIMVALVLGLWATMAQAETYSIPQGPIDQMRTSDYGGVQYSTISFSTQTFLIADNYGSLLGFVASSNTAKTDYISFYDTAAVLNPRDEQPGTEFARVHLSTDTGVGVSVITGSPILGTSYKFPASIRTKRGLVVRASVANINLLTILHTKFGQ